MIYSNFRQKWSENYRVNPEEVCTLISLSGKVRFRQERYCQRESYLQPHTCQGKRLSSASVPPTIRLSGDAALSLLLPHSFCAPDK